MPQQDSSRSQAHLLILQEELKILREKNQQLQQQLETSQQRHREIEQRLALHPISGLPTHYMMEAQIQELLSAAEKDSFHSYAFVLIQLGPAYDMVKRTMKSSVAEWVLYQLSQRLNLLLATDDHIFHTRENEFLILRRYDEDSVLTSFLTLIQHQVSEPHIFSGFNLTLESWIGVSLYPQHGVDRSALLHGADIALGHCQELKAPFIIFDVSLEKRVLEKMELQNAIIKAIEAPALKAIGHQFELYFQPKLTVQRQGQVWSVKGIQAEVLLRWNHPTKGQIQPSQFIPIAEETGLIMPIGKWSLYQVVQQLKDWDETAFREVHLAFNVSARQFRSHDLVEIFQKAIRKHKAVVEKLTLEVTETSLFEDPLEAEQILKAFKNFGLKISVDDFGTGFSSLSHLHKFTLDEIKIDQSFVRGLPENPQDLAIVRSLISIAKELNLHIVAEGVETLSQLEELADLGCQTVQGFLISRPLPRAAFESFVHKLQKNGHCLELTSPL